MRTTILNVFLRPLKTYRLSFIWLKAYVQQLESSKLKLAQLEQELQKARQQVFISWLHVCLPGAWKMVPLYCYFDNIEYFLQGIFISSSGDQTHAMSGNGNVSGYYICVALNVFGFD